MGKPRNWYTYEFKRGNKVLHGGRTQDLEQREKQFQTEINSKGHISKVGIAKTKQGAKDWEEKHGYS